MTFEIDPCPFERDDRSPPPGGWRKACTVADHKWTLAVVDGHPCLECVDPHPEGFADEVDLSRGQPVCLAPYWEAEDLFGEGIPVSVEHIDDSTSSTPAGPAEYGFYLLIRPPGEAA